MSEPPTTDSESVGGGNSLIERLTEKIEQWQPVSHEQAFGNAKGAYCIVVATDRKDILVTAKSYAFNKQASFPKRVPEKADSRDLLVAVFFDDPELTLGNGYVYDPSHVLSQGVKNVRQGGGSTDEPTLSASGQKVWLDIPLADGVVFGDYITDHDDVVHKNNILEYIDA